MCQFALLGDAGVERLRARSISWPVRRCDDVPTAFGEGDDGRSLAADDVRHGAGQPQRTEVLQVLPEHAEALVWPSQFVCRDDSEGSNAAKRSDFGAAE